MRVAHYFESTGEAYDASQTSDAIRDGDILVVEAERVVGILVAAWPTAVTIAHGEFHQLGDQTSWADLEGGRYLDSATEATRLAKGM